jgi:hypothetical protein
MVPPTYVDVGPYRYRIGWTEKRWRKVIRQTENVSSAYTCNATLRIDIEPGLAYGAAREVLMHELMHAAAKCSVGWDTIDVAAEGIDGEELAIRMLSPHMLDILRRNPHVVAWLTA